MEKFGNWTAFANTLSKVTKKYAKNMDRATKEVARKVQKSMITGTSSRRFNLAENAQSTIDRKGSSTPLIDNGDLMGSIAIINRENRDGYLVGANRNALNKDGKHLVNIFAVNTYGVDKVVNGRRIKIPARDIITPSIKENEDNFVNSTKKALRDTFDVS